MSRMETDRGKSCVLSRELNISRDGTRGGDCKFLKGQRNY